MGDSTAIFRQACRAEVDDRIRNQVLVNRLTATSSKITKISWWEMLVNYQWNWCWLSWQISHLTLAREHDNLNDFVCCIPQMKREFRASVHQSTKYPANIDRQTYFYGTFASMCNWFRNKSPTHTFVEDWETRHCNWAAPCYFNGASPTGSSRWGHCLQRHLACEGLYAWVFIRTMHGNLKKVPKFSPSHISQSQWWNCGITVMNFLSYRNYRTQLFRKLFLTKLSQNSYLNYH